VEYILDFGSVFGEMLRFCRNELPSDLLKKHGFSGILHLFITYVIDVVNLQQILQCYCYVE